MSSFLDLLRCLLCCEYEVDRNHFDSGITSRDYFQEPTSYSSTPHQSSIPSSFLVPEEPKLPLLSTSSYNYTHSGISSSSIYQSPTPIKPPTSSSEPPKSSSYQTRPSGPQISSPKPSLSSFKASKPLPHESSAPSCPSSSRSSLASFNSSPSPSSNPSSQKLPPIFKPTLREVFPNATNQKGQANYVWVEKDSLPLYMIPEDMKDLIKNDIVPDVLKKPLSPLTYKDYFAALLYAEEYYSKVCFGFSL